MKNYKFEKVSCFRTCSVAETENGFEKRGTHKEPGAFLDSVYLGLSLPQVRAIVTQRHCGKQVRRNESKTLGLLLYVMPYIHTYTYKPASLVASVILYPHIRVSLACGKEAEVSSKLMNFTAERNHQRHTVRVVQRLGHVANRKKLLYVTQIYISL